MLRALDDSAVNKRYVILMAAVMIGAVLDLFDFFLIAFVVPILNDEWSLTFGEATAMLLSAGFGAILGSVVWGRLGESHGRRRPLIAGLLIFSLGTGVTGSDWLWIALAVLLDLAHWSASASQRNAVPRGSR